MTLYEKKFVGGFVIGSLITALIAYDVCMTIILKIVIQ